MSSVDFDNASFWDDRYRSKPDLGSGLGSRGTERLRKQNALELVVRHLRPGNVVDIGCGDFTVVRPLCSLAPVTGVDVSMAAVDRCRARFPGRFQKLIDLEWLHRQNFDLAVCLDVTIHQPSFDEYTGLVRAVTRSARHVVISGFQRQPERQHASDITFFHQPLVETLEALGCTDIRALIDYRGTTMVLARSPAEA